MFENYELNLAQEDLEYAEQRLEAWKYASEQGFRHFGVWGSSDKVNDYTEEDLQKAIDDARSYLEQLLADK